MQIALIGWQSGGKSTLFKALTGMDSPFGEEAHPGIARVPDPVLDQLHDLFPTSKKVNARVDYLDVAGLAASEKRTGFKRSLINHLQGANVLAAVVGTYQHGEMPAEDLAEDVVQQVTDLETEMLLSDLQVMENRVEKIESSKHRGQKIDPTDQRAVEKAHAALNEEKPLREVEFDTEEAKALRPYGLLTQKALMVLVNHGEDQDGEGIRALAEPKLQGTLKTMEVLNGQLEAEIASLEEEDRGVFLEEMGLDAAASDRVIRSSFGLLGLIRFFTVGDDECRAWPIPVGMAAQQAAGEIHSDLERGFIRAEVVPSDELLRLKTLAACRDNGLLRLEGKTYIVKDGDVMHIRFAV